MMLTGAWRALRGARRGGVREVRLSSASEIALHATRCACSTSASSTTSRSTRRTRRSRRPTQIDDLIAAFERRLRQALRARRRARRSSATWSRRRSCAARSTVEKPALPTSRGAERLAAGRRRTRAVPGGATARTTETDIYEMDDVRAGHAIEGPAIVEALVDDLRDPARTRRAWIDTRHLPPRRHEGGLERWRSSTPPASSSRGERGRSAGTASALAEMLAGSPSGCSPRPATTQGLERARAEGGRPDRLREALLARCAAAWSRRARPR